MNWLTVRIKYLREGLGVIGEMLQGLITVDEAGDQVTRLRAKYGLADR